MCVHLVGVLVDGVICCMVVSVVVVRGAVMCGAVWVLEGARDCCGYLVCVRRESWAPGVKRRGSGVVVVPVAHIVPMLRV